MNIGIITLNDNHNYGNRLQNYAMQEVLSSHSCYVETILVKNEAGDRGNKYKEYLKKIRSLKGKIFFVLIKKIIWKFFSQKKYLAFTKAREEKFKEFSERYIIETSYSINEKNIPVGINEKYDYYIVGSDQVWNPEYIKGNSIYFLDFAPKEKRISYAASFGISKIPQEYEKRYIKWIKNMRYISVREDSGADIIKELIDLEVPVHVDPTLLLTKEQWINISKISDIKPKEKYLLTYFLGKVSRDRSRYISGLAKRNGLKIINLNSMKDKESYSIEPREFIDLINGCSIIVTDSFHGAVFSILMERPFIVYERKSDSASIYSRINSLLFKFQLESRKIINIKSDNDALKIDFSHVKPILENERRKSMDYIKSALNIKDDK